MRQAVRIFVWIFGVICCLIAFAHIAVGPRAIPGAVEVNAIMDSEDRFYSTLFLGFGAALLWCAFDLQRRGSALKFLLAIFFCGGLARLISLAVTGYPSHLFFTLMWIELLLPPLVWYVHAKAFPDRQVGADGLDD